MGWNWWAAPLSGSRTALAKSSRNTYLTPQERQAARVLSQAVFLGQKLVAEGERDGDRLVQAMKACLLAQPLARIDYVQAVDSETLEPVHTLRGTVLVALAVYLGKTRLIDNFIAEGL